MKKIISLLIVCMLCVSLFSACGGGEKPELKVYNAGEYIEKSLLSRFEDEFDCKVVYETFDSNEAMYTKIKSGEKYDILIPSDYMVERLIKEDYLAPLNRELIPNMANLMPEVLNQSFDPESTYTAPYFWGSVGILYNKEVVAKEDLAAGWELLRNPKYKDDIYMYDSERDAFMIALKALGYSMNTENTSELDEAYNWLTEQKNLANPIYVGDDVIDSMISGNKSIAIVYSGDASYIITENPELDFFKPHQGTNIWYDSMVMTKDCVNTDLAHSFINFMLDEEIALLNSEAVGYTSPVKSAFDEMKGTIYDGVSAYIPTPAEKDEIFKYQPTELKQYSADLWIKVKAN
jgi:spermidine/putrescine transport system permease protein